MNFSPHLWAFSLFLELISYFPAILLLLISYLCYNAWGFLFCLLFFLFTGISSSQVPYCSRIKIHILRGIVKVIVSHIQVISCNSSSYIFKGCRKPFKLLICYKCQSLCTCEWAGQVFFILYRWENRDFEILHELPKPLPGFLDTWSRKKPNEILFWGI